MGEYPGKSMEIDLDEYEFGPIPAYEVPYILRAGKPRWMPDRLWFWILDRIFIIELPGK
jgi:hypothetical protein